MYPLYNVIIYITCQFLLQISFEFFYFSFNHVKDLVYVVFNSLSMFTYPPYHVCEQRLWQIHPQQWLCPSLKEGVTEGMKTSHWMDNFVINSC